MWEPLNKGLIKIVTILNKYWRSLISHHKGHENVQITCRLHVCDCVRCVHAFLCLYVYARDRHASTKHSLAICLCCTWNTSPLLPRILKPILRGGFGHVEECVPGPTLRSSFPNPNHDVPGKNKPKHIRVCLLLFSLFFSFSHSFICY